jgi:hypothetical protein
MVDLRAMTLVRNHRLDYRKVAGALRHLRFDFALAQAYSEIASSLGATTGGP